MFLRQSTSQVVRFGPFLDITDGVTEEVALTITQAEMRLSKDGAAFAQKNAAGNATHDSDGWYSTTLNGTDTDTVGELVMNVQQPANTLPVWVRWYVVEEAVYDAFYAAGAVHTVQTGDSFARLGAPAGASVSADVAAVKTVADAIEVDTQDLQARTPAALVGGRMDSNVSALDNDNTAAVNLSKSASQVIQGSVDASPTPTTTTFADTGVSGAVDDFYNGRIIIFTSGTLAGQAKDITDFTGSTKLFTVTALTAAPTAADTFVIV